MTKADVVALLEAHRNERGIEHWRKLAPPTGELRSYGIGLTQLRKLAGQIGRDHELAQQLWKSDIYDARVVGLLIDEPGKMTREQAERQVDDLAAGMLAHVFASCNPTLARTSFVVDIATAWADSEDDMRRRCGFLLLSELSKNRRDKALDDAFFIDYIGRIQDTIHEEANWVRDAMIAALLGIGKRNLKLNKAAVRAVKAIGPVAVDYGDNRRESPDLLDHLTSDLLRKKLAS